MIVLHLAQQNCIIKMTKKEYSDKIAPFVPPNTSDMITEWVFKRRIDLRITKGRKTKLGDYKISMRPNSIPSISINGDQNKYSFLITLIHEFAHAQVHEKYGNNVKPHGNEWKNEYRELMTPYFEKNVFPEPLQAVLTKHFNNPKASSQADIKLVKELSKFDSFSNTPVIRLEDLAKGTEFIISRKRLVKGEKRRTRYMCHELGKPNNKYTVSAMAEVKLP